MHIHLRKPAFRIPYSAHKHFDHREVEYTDGGESYVRIDGIRYFRPPWEIDEDIADENLPTEVSSSDDCDLPLHSPMEYTD